MYLNLKLEINLIKMNISNCGFYNSHCSNSGGAIYFFSTSLGEFSLKNICCNNCSAKYEQFSYICTKSLGYNDLSFLSIIKSSSQITTTKYYTISNSYGIQEINNLNISKNYVQQISGFYTNDPSYFKAIFISFIDNYSSQSICTLLSSGTNNRNLYYLNYINNTQGQSTIYSILYVHINGEYSVYNSIFDKNNYILLSCQTGYLLILNCIMNHLTSNLKTGLVTLVSNNTQYTNYPLETNFFLIYSSYYCLKLTNNPSIIFSTNNFFKPQNIIIFLNVFFLINK